MEKDVPYIVYESEAARHEQHDYYIKSGRNTYVKNKVEKLKQEGRL